MSKLIPIQYWLDYFKNRGLAVEVYSTYIPYIECLYKNDCPIIFEFEHLSKLTGINKSELAKMVNSPESYYRKFTIPKKRGGKREISSPYPSLLHVQRWIYENILLKQKIHSAAHGFVRNKSIISNAKKHLGKKALLKMDLENFFPSIPINWIIKLFNDLGYAKNVSFALASLCCLDDCLCQGAATSPFLSNIVLKSLDYRLRKLAVTYDLVYTRYADDLVFSGAYIPHSFVGIVSGIIFDYGLKVNVDKTRLHTKQGQRIVTGLSVSGDTLKLPRKYKREIRKDIHYIGKFGYLSHANKTKIRNPNYLESLYGKLQFWLQVEPECDFALNGIKLIENIRS